VEASDSSDESRTNTTWEHLNRGAVAKLDSNSAKRIASISRRNLQLALVTVTSTGLAMLLLAWANISAPSETVILSGGLEYGAYLERNLIGELAGVIDSFVNFVAILFMTSSWQPASFKRTLANIKTQATTRLNNKVADESVVSSLSRG
jgi:L-lactate permease